MNSEVAPTYVRLAREWKSSRSVLQEAYSYDDFLLRPGFSDLSTLDEVDPSTELVSGLKLSIPIISANMDSVTEAPMAAFMAKVGGIGILHRVLSIDEQVRQIKLVKEATNYVVKEPPRLSPNDSVEKARYVMGERQRGFVLIIDDDGGLAGLASTRDVGRFARGDAPLSYVMTPRERLVLAPPGISMTDAQKIMYENRIEKLPLIDSEGNIGGVITDRDISILQNFPNATKDEHGRLRVGAAIGTQDEAVDRAKASIEAGVDVIVIDVLHGDQERAYKLLRTVKSLSPNVPVIVGNVATSDATIRLSDAGADAVKVGYGPGAMCTTQRVTGTGSQQASAVAECAEALYSSGSSSKIIADGGVRGGGDVTKALALGADSVMVGTLLAGTDESPGEIMVDDTTGDMYKNVRGMASEKARDDLARARNARPKNRVAQGTTSRVVYSGSAQRVVDQLVGGLTSGMANTGARNLDDLRMKAVFQKQTLAGQSEGRPHVHQSHRKR